MEYNSFFNLQVELNDICNLTCKHCYQIRAKAKEELDIDLVLSQLENLKKITGYQKHIFRLSGGEATLRKDLFKVIRNIKSHGYYVEVMTNGMFLDLPYVYALKSSGIDICQVSMDGSSAEIHNYVRGQGAYEKSIKGIKNLVKVGIPVEIKLTLIKGINTDDIRNMFSLCTELDVKYISLARFIFAGNGIQNFGRGNLIGNEVRDIFYKIAETGREFPQLNINVRDQLGRIVDIDIPKNVDMTKEPYMGVSYLAIDTYGNVYADRQLDIIIGNIHQQTLSEIWTGSSKLQDLRESKKYLRGKCIDCKINDICLGGNKTAAYALTGSPFEPDPGCWINEPINKIQLVDNFDKNMFQ
ncbi:MAG: radical SAM protein [Candidatus Sericytochromatia bacterium]|nr:radical SAM protein [Candidatus Sericytochromatia bacterium]